MNSGDASVNKDIIYIDVEDDVTSVIGKLRASAEKIVALVPPKSSGTLQSAVNLRLLTKAADSAGKRIVLITANPGLTALAASAKIPVAKNLQSKPEIPAAPTKPAPADDDVIRGDELPVGELAAAAAGVAQPNPAAAQPAPAALRPADDDIVISGLPDLDKEVPAVATAAGSARKKGGPRVPDFNRFRKLIFIGAGLIVAIIAFFVLTNIFWTGANVVIAASTSDQAVDVPLTVSATASTDPDSSIIRGETKTLKKTASVDFTPTGKKNVGERATGTVKFSTNSISNLGTTIAAGTELTTSGGSVFTTNQAVTITFSNYNDAETGVTAKSQGASSNGASGTVQGAPSGINASLVGTTAGGTDKTVTVVSSDDISAATGKLSEADADAAKSELAQQFGSGYVIIGDSFTSQNGDPVSNPGVGSEASAAKLTRDSTYALTAIPKTEIKTVVAAALNGEIDTANQKVYDDGSNGARITRYVTSPSGVQTLNLSTTAKIGPNIDENALKTQFVGKKAAEITQIVKAAGGSGVKDVTVSFSPFWRSTAPAADKIAVSFELKNGN